MKWLKIVGDRLGLCTVVLVGDEHGQVLYRIRRVNEFHEWYCKTELFRHVLLQQDGGTSQHRMKWKFYDETKQRATDVMAALHDDAHKHWGGWQDA